MKRIGLFLIAICLCSVCSTVYGLWIITDKGTWPKSWPNELEPLREQSRTLTGSALDLTHYEIPFAKRKHFESAWPHILKLKSRGAPLILLRGPDKDAGATINAGVRVWCPPEKGNQANPSGPIPGATNARERWIWTTYIELIVDGDIVDLNRIPLPPDTPVIDMRFEKSDHE